MSRIEEGILDYLRRHPEGVDDDDLAVAMGFSHRQQANQYCGRMKEKGLVERRKVDGKFHNFLAGAVPGRQEALRPAPATTDRGPGPEDRGAGGLSAGEEAVELRRAAEATSASDRPWYWEGNVQNAVVAHLAARGFAIERTADTASRETGKDIEATKGAHRLWVTVKDFPEKTPRTQPSTQAGHWFKDALFDIIAWRGEDPNTGLAMALPDFPRYRKLAAKVAWLQPVAKSVYLWVDEEGSVQVEG